MVLTLKKYDAILWDIDGTLLDFLAAERYGIFSCMEEIGVKDFNDEMLARYAVINRSYWKRLELGEVTREEVYTGRYRDFFAQEGIECDDLVAVNESYQRHLGEVAFPNDDAIALVEKLKKDYKQYAVTNGSITAQNGKLAVSGLDKLLDAVFISEEIGAEKPNLPFFEAMFAQIPEKDPKRMIIVGDSLTSDMKGGNLAGIPSVWYNPRKSENHTDAVPDYEIQNLWELLDILEK